MKKFWYLLLSSLVPSLCNGAELFHLTNGVVDTPFSSVAFRSNLNIITNLSFTDLLPPAGAINGKIPITSGGLWVVGTIPSGGTSSVIVASAPLIATTDTNGNINLSISNVWLTKVVADTLYANIVHTHSTNDINYLNTWMANAQTSINGKEPLITAGAGTNVIYANKTNGPVYWNYINGIPLTFNPSAHTHPASDIVSGILNILRIPDLSSLYLPLLGTAANSSLLGGYPIIWAGGTLLNTIPVINTLGYIDTKALRFWPLGNQTYGQILSADTNGVLYFNGSSVRTLANSPVGTTTGTLAAGDHTHPGMLTGGPGSVNSVPYFNNSQNLINGPLVVSGNDTYSPGDIYVRSVKVMVQGDTAANSLQLQGYGSSYSSIPSSIPIRGANGEVSSAAYVETYPMSVSSPAVISGIMTKRTDNYYAPANASQIYTWLGNVTAPLQYSMIPASGLVGYNFNNTASQGWAVNFGGVGSATSVSRSDHYHPNMVTASGGSDGYLAMFSGNGTNLTSSLIQKNGTTYQIPNNINVDGSVTASSYTGVATNMITGLDGRLDAIIAVKENNLGNPAANGYILSSTTAGVRSWVVKPSGGGGVSGSGTVNHVTKWDSSGVAIVDSLITDNGTDINLNSGGTISTHGSQVNIYIGASVELQVSSAGISTPGLTLSIAPSYSASHTDNGNFIPITTTSGTKYIKVYDP